MNEQEAEARGKRVAAICHLAWAEARAEPTFEDAAKRYSSLLAETVYRTLRNQPEEPDTLP